MKQKQPAVQTQFRILLLGTALLPSAVLGQSRNAPSPEHWVSTWATAESLAPVSGRGGGGGRAAAPRPQNGPPAAANNPQGIIPPSLNDQTMRMVVHTSIGGHRVRVQFSVASGASELTIGSAHIAARAKESAIDPATDRVLTFGGKPGCTIQPGVLMFSDPVDLEVAPMSDLAVSIYLPKDTGPPSNHPVGLHTAYFSKGDVTGQTVMPEPSTTTAYLWLSSVDVAADPKAFAIVAYGDSITDGYATTRDANLAWPALLAKRLAANKATAHIAVVNQGISGNQVLRDGAGISALARFDRDVLSRPGVKWMILLEGINDINIRGRNPGPEALTSDELIAGYRQLIDRAHSAGIRVIGATIMPEEGVPTASERGEEIRTSVNQWIRASKAFDAVVDFDAVVRDPQHPVRIRADFDPGDHIHPNDAGNQAMADAFDLAIFRK